MTSEEKYNWYIKVFRPLVEKQVDKLCNRFLYYEVWIDLDEEFEKWFDYMYKYTNLAAYSLARWLIRRDKWYWSPQYIKELDEAIKKTNSTADAFSNVLISSFKK